MSNVSEIAPDIFRICIYDSVLQLQFNQFLVRDREPLLYHTGMRTIYAQVRDAIAEVIDPASLRWIAFSHFEADECGSLNEFLSQAPEAQPLCSLVAAMVSVNDFACRPARGLQDGETLTIGKRRLRFFRTPHLPHGWEAGHLLEESTRTLFCSDLFHQEGDVAPEISSEEELLERARNTLLRYQSGPFSNYLPFTPQTEKLIGKLAASAPAIVAPMHGSTFKGDGQHALARLAKLFSEVLPIAAPD